jgi:type III secretory pathway component EscV
MREKLELNLLESGPPGAGEQTPQELRTQAIAEFVTASALDSDSAKEDYQARIISLQSRDWNIAQGIYARLNTYSFIDLIEIQVSESMIQDLFNADSSLKEGLQKNISDLRQDMIAELGVTLPRVTFRDNKAFAAGQFGVYVCGIPYASGTSTDSTPEDKWTILTDSLRTAAASHMAEYFGPQDAVKIIKDAAKDQPDFSTLLADPQALADATIVLRGLLSEGVSVKSANLPLILSTVLTGRSAGSDLLSMQEHIRCSNPVRPELPGNEGVTRRFLRLGSQLDAGISLCIDTSWGQPFLNPNVQQAMGLVNQIYTALGPVAGSGQAALLTSVKTRAFVRLLTQPSFHAVPVLSDREILLPLLAQVQSEI